MADFDFTQLKGRMAQVGKGGHVELSDLERNALIDSAMNGGGGSVDPEEVQELIDESLEGYYNKFEVDSELNTKSDKSDTYTKAQVDETLATLEGGTAKVVSSLPTASADTQGDIYYVTSSFGNSLMGYVTVKSGSSYQWANVVSYNFSNVGNGYACKGVAMISTNPDTTASNVFYILGEVGTYPNMGSIVHASGIGIALWNGTAWSYQNVPSAAVVQTDATPTANSTKPVQSGGVASALDDYYVNEEVTINNNAQRTKTYNLAPGTKIAIRVSLVSGTSKTCSISWTKSGGNVLIYNGYPLGFLTPELVVPNDATGITLFINPAASGNKALVEIFKAERTSYLNAEITKNINGIEYLNNKVVVSKTASVVVSSSLQEILTVNDCRLLNLEGYFYALVSTTALFYNDFGLRFYWTDGTTDQILWLGRNPIQFYGFASVGQKKLDRVAVFNNAIETAGDVSITIFAKDESELLLKYPLKNKKVMLFGDSGTEFKSSIDNRRYSDWLTLISLAETYNVGIGGTCLSARSTLSLTPSGNQQAVAAFDMVSLVEAWTTNDYQYQDAALASGLLTDVQQTLYTSKLAILKSTPIGSIDIVTIFGGTNDYNSSHSIGLSSLSNTDKLSICGSINKIAQLLYTAKPTLRVLAFTPIPYMYGETISNENISDVYIPEDAPEGKTLPEVGEIIENSWKANHIPVDNWYWEFGVNAYNWDTYYTDGAHIQKGYEIVARKMYQFILANPIGK